MPHQLSVNRLTVNIALICCIIRSAGRVSRVLQMTRCVFLLWLPGNVLLLIDFDPLSSAGSVIGSNATGVAVVVETHILEQLRCNNGNGILARSRCCYRQLTKFQ